MDEHVFGFFAASALFCYVLGWKGLLIALYFFLGFWAQSKVSQKKKSKLLSSKQPESEQAESKQPVSAENGESSREDDLAMSIIAATCGSE